MSDEKRIRSYPKVYNLGHPVIAHLFRGPIVIQEKVDGSQFSFGLVDGELHMRSKRAVVREGAVPNLFEPAAAHADRLASAGKLTGGWIYRCEAVCRPKHNTLAYERAPEAGMVLFDVDTGLEDRGTEDLADVAGTLDMEAVPESREQKIDDLTALHETMKARAPMLGGEMVEGIVIKNYAEFNPRDGKMLMGKLVQEAFRERHSREWKKTNPGKGDVVERIIDDLRTEARWLKAVQHLEERGELTQSPRDIGPLLKEVQQDTQEEEAEYIKDALYKAFWKQIGRGSTRGLPEWYKARLIESQGFDADDAA